MRVRISLSVFIWNFFLFINIEKSWYIKLSDEFKKQYIKDLFKFLKRERESKIVLPKWSEVFNCLNYVSFDDVRVVILGQDPYCYENQAHGLSFSVPPQTPLTSSLKNIYRELHSDLGVPIPKIGFLGKWTKQGVLLLNSVLTVEKGAPGSHLDIGWELFTDKIISLLSECEKKIIFVFWGNSALEKIDLVDFKDNFVISSSHPSNKSAFKGFFGSRPFSRINMHLKLMNETPINWSV